jgi:Gly-Xaa carboxypeptidase
MPKTLRQDVEKLGKSLAIAKKHRKGKGDKKALKRIEEWWVNGSEEDGTLPPGAGRAMVSTTQAVDIINGGVKVNALVCHPIYLRVSANEIARSSHCDSQPPN